MLPRALKGQGKGPKTLACSPAGQLLAGDQVHGQIICWQKSGHIARVLHSKRDAAVFAWEDQFKGHAGFKDEDIVTAAIDGASCLCIVRKNLLLYRQSPSGELQEIGSLRGSISMDEENPCNLTLDLAVLGQDWFVADLFGHQLLRWREGIGAERVEILRGNKGDAPSFRWPRGIAADRTGSLFISLDLAYGKGVVLERSARGEVRTLVERLHCPGAIAVAGNDIYIAESGRHCVWTVHRVALANL